VALIIMNLNKSPLSRLLNFDISSPGFYIRFVFYRDALKIFLDNWLFGTGGGGWEILYGQYQSLYYTSKLVHSSLIQFLVEVGIVGTSLFLVIVALAFIKFIQCTENKQLDQVFLLVFLTIFLHSFIDFDLSIPAVTMVMFTVMGIISKPSGNRVSKKISYLGVLTLCLILLISSVVMGLAGVIRNSAVSNGTVDDIETFKNAITTATILDPLNVDYLILLGQAYLNEGIHDNSQELIEQGLGYYKKAVELEPKKYLTHIARGIALQSIGRFDEASAEYNEVIKLRPFHGIGYDYAMKNYLEKAVKYKDKNTLQEVIKIYESAKEQMLSIPESELGYVDENYRLNNLPELNISAGIAFSLLGNYENGYNYFIQAQKYSKGELLHQSNAWLFVVGDMINVENNIIIGKQVAPERVQEVREKLDVFKKD